MTAIQPAAITALGSPDLSDQALSERGRLVPASFLGDSMLIQISLADVVLEITSPRDLDLEDRILPFLCAGRVPDVRYK